jgi:hypothetical protein
MASGTKAQASKSTVPMHPALAEVLKAWQAETPYNKPDDFVFASFKLHGKKPRTGNMIRGGLPETRGKERLGALR